MNESPGGRAPVQLTKRRFTVDEYHRMAEAGILSEDDRVELIDGEIVEMAAIGSRHAACARRLNSLFTEALRGRAIVDVADPVNLSRYSEPEPDTTVLRPRADFYSGSHQTPADVLLLIEIGESTARTDRAIKAPLYARAGIVEYWLVDLQDEVIEVYADPGPNGYAACRRCGRGALITPANLEGVSLTVDAILG
jgi:Uma2 family endonuclease